MNTMTAAVRLALRQAVESYSEAIVQLADATLAPEMMSKLLKYDGYDPKAKDYYIQDHGRRWYRSEIKQGDRRGPREPQPEMEASLINNLLGVALETSSPAVVENWVRYQMGRRETERAWSDTGLGDQVIADINQIREQMVTQVAQKAFGDQTDEHLQQAHIALVRLYAGYLKRWFVAKGGQR